MSEEKEVKTIKDKEKIVKIIEEKIKGRKLVFTEWYKIGILKKGIPEEKFDEVFPQFDKVCTVEVEELKKGDLGYELFYELSGNVTISIATIPKEKDLLIINSIQKKLRLQI